MNLTTSATLIRQAQNSTKTEIAFIENNLSDYQTLINDIPKNVEVVLLDSKNNGLEQIADYLKSKPAKSIDAIHLFSHGQSGQINLGSLTLNSDNLNQNSELIQKVSNYLTENGDILIYGCDVAENQVGVNFVQKLSQLTNADIASSDNLTGNEKLGGDWVLENHQGNIESSSIKSIFYNSILSTPVEGTTNFNTTSAGGYNEYAKGNALNGLIAQDISGWKISGYSTSNSDTWIIAGENWQNQISGFSGLAYFALETGNSYILSVRYASNDGKLFDLNSIKLGYDITNPLTNQLSFTITGYNNGSIVGSPIMTNAFTSFGNGATSWYSVSNINLVGIDEFRITPSPANLLTALDFDDINAVNFRTPSVADTTPPVFDNATPSALNIGSNSLSLSTSIDESGKIYYVVVPNNATAPTSAEVKAGTVSGGASALKSGNATVSTGDFSNTFSISGLTANTDYDVYVVADDSANNLMTSPTKVDVKTLLTGTLLTKVGTESIAFNTGTIGGYNVITGLAGKEIFDNNPIGYNGLGGNFSADSFFTYNDKIYGLFLNPNNSFGLTFGRYDGSQIEYFGSQLFDGINGYTIGNGKIYLNADLMNNGGTKIVEFDVASSTLNVLTSTDTTHDVAIQYYAGNVYYFSNSDYSLSRWNGTAVEKIWNAHANSSTFSNNMVILNNELYFGAEQPNADAGSVQGKYYAEMWKYNASTNTVTQLTDRSSSSAV